MRSVSSNVLLSAPGLLVLSLLSCRPLDGPVTPLVEPSPSSPPALDAPKKTQSTTPPPISLTASDGTGLSLASMNAWAVVDDPLTLTELELEFDNPRQETIEGRFEIRLPPGAQVTRFAMEIGGQWQEAEVVEKQRARQTYETFLHQQRDPALLERDTGNRFRARVFPIAAGERKRLLVSYTQEFADPEESYRLSTGGLPWLERLDIHVLTPPGEGQPRVEELHQTRRAPGRDFVVHRDAPDHGGLRREDHVVARVQPLAGVDPGESEPLEGLTVLIDSSASRALEFGDDVQMLGDMLSVLGRHHGEASLRVLAYDQEVVPIYEGSLAGFRPDEHAALRARLPLGASDLGRALEAITKDGNERVLLITDGLISMGEDSTAALHRTIETLGEHGVRRIDALAVGGVRDEERLAQLVTGPLSSSGVILRPKESAEHNVLRLLQPTFDDVEVVIPGARWSSPTHLDGLQPGDHVLVYADLPKTRSLEIELSGPVRLSHAIPLRPHDSPLLDHAFHRAEVDQMVQDLLALEDATESTRLRRRIVATSVEHRIFNDFTAFLVLETHEDYARFGLTRRGLSDILIVGKDGAELLQRTAPVIAGSGGGTPGKGTNGADSITQAGRVVNMEEFRNIPVGNNSSRDFTQVIEAAPTASRSAAGISLAGTTSAEVHYTLDGASIPRYLPSSEPRPARVRVHAVQVIGEELSRRSAREVARAERSSLEACYFESLEKDGTSRGRLTVELQLSTTGRVIGVGKRGTSAIDDPDLLRCIENALLQWSYPTTGRRPSRVTQTLIFRPFDGPPDDFEGTTVDPTSTPPSVPPPTPLAKVQLALRAGNTPKAWTQASSWRAAAPVDLLAVVALGEAAQAKGDIRLAARAYGSILDLHPSRADMRRFAAGRLEALDDEAALAVAVDAYRMAVEQRPDHPSSHRNLAFALLRHGEPEAAFEALVAGIEQHYPGGRFASADRLMREDLQIVAAAWQRSEPERLAEIRGRASRNGITIAREPSLRFVMSWETDANDVDLHIYDAEGVHTSFEQPHPYLDNDVGLYADVTNGYGPECITTNGDDLAFPYRIGVHYYARGPMGYGMGKVQVIRHDGEGRVTMEDRPFIATTDRAYVDLGTVNATPHEGPTKPWSARTTTR